MKKSKKEIKILKKISAKNVGLLFFEECICNVSFGLCARCKTVMAKALLKKVLQKHLLISKKSLT